MTTIVAIADAELLNVESELEAGEVGPFDPGEFTQLLILTREGDPKSWGSLVRLVYADLRKLARRHVMSVSDQNTLGITGLVNECYLRLVGPARATVESRRHFLNLASRVMRQVLCDYAREQLSTKRGGAQRREDLLRVDAEEWAESEQLVILDDALRALEQRCARMARVFECRYFAGLGEEETAEALGLSLRSVQRAWHEARRWLAERLQ
ncbi:MAG TPA: ECF-type sigma factor [Rhodanobacteraceae bacterium]|nr:ECF-type sigma factor [Rhodanobacteraceae bacterium]